MRCSLRSLFIGSPSRRLFAPAIDLCVSSPLAGEGQGEGDQITSERSEHLYCKVTLSWIPKNKMRNYVVKLCLLLILIFFNSAIFAMDALVDSTWLAANKEKKGLILLDIQQPENYRRFHIVGAINAPYSLWRDNKNSTAPGMLPPTQQMERFIGTLGIDNESSVVIIATGNQAGDMAASSRVFWTFKVLGHRRVAILNGGLVDYAKTHPRDLEATPRYGNHTHYKTKPDRDITASAADVKGVLNSDTQLLDARTLGEYTGVITPKPDERPGTIPGARHLPFNWFINEQGRIRNKATVLRLFKYAGLDSSQDGTIHFCHTGNRAALTWFVDYAILGNRRAKLYDASMSEWAKQKKLPMERRIEF